jgi:HTH-type transcriptional regulator/antitoxin HipB
MAIRSEENLGHALRRHRLAKGLNQTELGQKAHLRQRTVSDIEQGKGGTLASLSALLTAMGLEVTVAAREDRDIEPDRYL